MSGRASPFAALTGAEKQIKWLEVQSLRLPYMQGALESDGEAVCADAAENNVATRTQDAVSALTSGNARDMSEPRAAAKQPPSRSANESSAPTGGTERGDFQRTRHRQYDAVIARMRQAEMRAQGFKPIV